jgi:hypothetical protein
MFDVELRKQAARLHAANELSRKEDKKQVRHPKASSKASPLSLSKSFRKQGEPTLAEEYGTGFTSLLINCEINERFERIANASLGQGETYPAILVSNGPPGMRPVNFNLLRDLRFHKAQVLGRTDGDAEGGQHASAAARPTRRKAAGGLECAICMCPFKEGEWLKVRQHTRNFWLSLETLLFLTLIRFIY